MSLEADASVDRRRLKRRLRVWRLTTIGTALLVLRLAAYRTGIVPPRAFVAQLDISGILVGDDDQLRALAGIADDPSARALIVRIDSPGGTVVAGETLFHAIREVAEAKPVVAVIGNLGTSAGYLVALAADHIIARESSITGSIGVPIQTADLTQLMEKLGVSTEAIKSTTLKATPSPLEPITPEARAATQAVVDDIYRWFVDLVADRRAFTPVEALLLSDGRVFTGRQAISNNLSTTSTAWTRHVCGCKPRSAFPRTCPSS